MELNDLSTHIERGVKNNRIIWLQAQGGFDFILGDRHIFKLMTEIKAEMKVLIKYDPWDWGSIQRIYSSIQIHYKLI